MRVIYEDKAHNNEHHDYLTPCRMKIICVFDTEKGVVFVYVCCAPLKAVLLVFLITFFVRLEFDCNKGKWSLIAIKGSGVWLQ